VSDLPVACTLGPGALGARRLGLLTDLLHLAKTHEEIPDGHRLFFDSSTNTFELITKAVDAERQCCRFLRFHITVEPDGGRYHWS
jgi:hypothetical protein